MAQSVTVTQNTAENFVSSLGVNTKAGTYSDAYTNASLIINSLDYLGISTVRDSYSEYGQANPVLDALANAGIQFDFRVNFTLPATGSAGLSDYIDALKEFVAEHPGSIIAVEGLNEANANSFSYNGDSSVAGAAAFQRDLYLAIKATPELSSVLVYNLSIAYNDPSVFAAVGDLGAYSDAANAHAYPNTGRAADAQVESIIALAQSNSQGDPLVVTETGYTTLESTPGVGVNEDAQAKLVLQNLLAAYEDGSTKTYLYTLFDEPSVASTRGAKEVSFGLFNADGSPKEAAVAIHNLTTILNFGNDGSASTATDTAFTLSGATSDTHSMILTKSGGVYDIVLWQNVTVWNDVTDTEIVNSTTPVTVNLGETVSSVRIYDPLGGLDPIATYTNVSSFTVPLSDHPLVIEIGASEAVHEDVVTSAANLTMTSAEFVAQIDTLATATGLESVTLSDSHELAVASVETMQYIIANYGSLLSKIDGGYTFSVTYGQSTWRKEQIFDASGNLQTRIEYGVADDVVVSKVVYANDGTVDYYNYNITGQTYTSQHLTVNAAGVTVLTERFHADGTRDYVQTIATDGTKDTVTYNSAGQKTSDTLVAADGTRTTLTYDPSSGYLTQSVLQAASGVTTTKTYTSGVLTRTVVANTDGSVDYYNYNISGQTYTSQHQTVNSAGVTVLTERFHADGTRDYVQTIATDGTKDTVTYNSAGQKTSDISLAPDGSLTTLTYDPSTGYLTQSVLQATSGVTTTKTYTSGVLTRTVVANTDGSVDYYNYNITGQTYTSQHQTVNSAGVTVLTERFHADGTRDYMQTLATDGTKDTVTYNSAGQKTTDTLVAADGTRTTLTYDPSSGYLTQSVLQATSGVVTTKTYTSGVLTRTVVANTDSTVDYYYYNITGQTYTSQHQTVNSAGVTVLTERFHADGTRDYVQTIATDGTKDTVTYNSAGQKTSDISLAPDGSLTTLTYDPSTGYLTQSVLQATSGVTTTKTYTSGVLTRTVVANTDGSVDYYNYNITGQTYTSQHQTVNSAGVTVLTERFHADGTRDYVQTIATDGTKDTVTYNSAGQKTSDTLVAADGTRTTLTYDPSSGYLTQSVLQAASGVTTTKTYTSGVLTRTVVANTDGSVDYYNYNISGQTYTSQHQTVNSAGVTVLTERFHADGTRDYMQTLATDGTKDTVTYNSAGQKTTDTLVAADGTRTTLTYDPSSGYLTQSVLQATSGVVTTKTYTSGVLTRTVVANTDSTVDYYYYNITGQTYTSQHQTVNSAGVTVLTERFHADGTRDYVQTIATDGTKDTVTYNSAGQKTSDISLAPDGSLTTLTYDPSSGYLTQSVLQATSGVTTTKTYTSGVLTRTVVANTDGSVDYYNYNITGQTYTSQHQTVNSAGVTVLTERFHADGTRDYVQTIATDGTKDTVTYNSAGQKTSDISLAPDGSLTTLTYDPSTGYLTQSVLQATSGVTTTKTYTSGVLTRTVVANTDGSVDYYNYNITGQTYTSQHQTVNSAGVTVLTERFHADGTRDYVQTIATDGTKDTVTYNSAGQKTSDTLVAADGTRTTLTYDPSSGYLTQSVLQATSGVVTTKTYTSGVLTRTVVANTDSTVDYYYYNISGQTYTSQHLTVNSAGVTVLTERFHADGTRDYVQTIAANGTKDTINYNSAGQKTTDTIVTVDGSRTTLTYDPSSGNLTQSVAQDTSGTVTKTYTNGVLMKSVEAHSDGTIDYYNYNITGQTYTTQHQKTTSSGSILEIDRYHTDGTFDYVEVRHTDGSKDVSNYTSTGALLNHSAIQANGARVVDNYLQDGTGDIRHDTYDSSLTLLIRDYQHTDGTHTIYSYGNNQVLDGGAQNDTFYFRNTTGGTLHYDGGNDTVLNFDTSAGHIVIDSKLADSTSDLTITQTGSDVTITIDAHDTIVLKATTLANVHLDAFSFV